MNEIVASLMSSFMNDSELYTIMNCNFYLMKGVSESLAGRVAVIQLMGLIN